MNGELFENEREPKAAKGHAAPPGTGPAGKTCGDCKHCDYVKRSKRYFKCGLLRHAWTNGPGTDIRKRDAACRYFELLRTTKDAKETKGKK